MEKRINLIATKKNKTVTTKWINQWTLLQATKTSRQRSINESLQLHEEKRISLLAAEFSFPVQRIVRDEFFARLSRRRGPTSLSCIIASRCRRLIPRNPRALLVIEFPSISRSKIVARSRFRFVWPGYIVSPWRHLKRNYGVIACSSRATALISIYFPNRNEPSHDCNYRLRFARRTFKRWELWLADFNETSRRSPRRRSSFRLVNLSFI